MSSKIGMFFHTKKINLQRKNNNVKRVPTPSIIRNPKNTPTAILFAEPMIQRVMSGKSGCSACGK